MDVDEYLGELRERLSRDEFTMLDESRVGRYDVSLVAYEISSPSVERSIKNLQPMTLRIIVAAAMNPIDSGAAKEFSSVVTKHVLDEWRGDKWEAGYGIFCFPVMVSGSFIGDLKDWIRGYVAPKHWLASEFPVLVATADQELYFCEKTLFWGGAYSKGLRKFAQEKLGFQSQSST